MGHSIRRVFAKVHSEKSFSNVVAMLRLQILNKFNNFQRPVSRGDRFKLTPQSLDS